MKGEEEAMGFVILHQHAVSEMPLLVEYLCSL